MGSVKNSNDEHNDRVQYALKDIAIPAGVVEECPHHPGTYLAGPQDIETAYRQGNVQWAKHQAVFTSRRQMTDAIKEAVETFVGESCYSCDKLQDE